MQVPGSLAGGCDAPDSGRPLILQQAGVYPDLRPDRHELVPKASRGQSQSLTSSKTASESA